MDWLKHRLDNLEFDFVANRKVAGVASILMVLLSWTVFVAIGPNWGIDFTGGTEIQLAFDEPIEISEVRGALTQLELGNDAVQAVGSEGREFKIRIQDPEFGMEELVGQVRGKLETAYGTEWIQNLDVSAEVGARFTVTYDGDTVTPLEVERALNMDGLRAQSGRDTNIIVITVPGLSSLVEKRIESVLGDKSFEVRSIDAVGPKVGGELRRQGFIAIAATLGLVLIYVAFRFDLAFAPGAILALIHDVSITVGIFVLAQLEFNLPMIGALLTIVGYSLNDTIVIYDRIRENRDRYNRKDTGSLINVSINETLTRTLATSATTMLAILMFLVFGGEVIRNFALAMFLGIIFGTYSTVFVASPMILAMEKIQPHLSALLALPVLGDEDEDEDGEVDGEGEVLTASEQRRRERAEAQRRELD